MDITIHATVLPEDVNMRLRGVGRAKPSLCTDATRRDEMTRWLTSSSLTIECLERNARLMKTMTCQQLGGPCESPHHGNNANEVIKAQDKHLKDMVASGDDAHQSALKEMQGRWKNPLLGMGWYRKARRDFAALPED